YRAAGQRRPPESASASSGAGTVMVGNPKPRVSLSTRNIPAIGRNPVRRNGAPRFCQRTPAGTHKPVQCILQLILPIGIPAIGRASRLRPQVARIGRRSAEIQRHEMVFLVVPEPPIGITILANLPTLQ